MKELLVSNMKINDRDVLYNRPSPRTPTRAFSRHASLFLSQDAFFILDVSTELS
jgi:hypothetical protein